MRRASMFGLVAAAGMIGGIYAMPQGTRSARPPKPEPEPEMEPEANTARAIRTAADESRLAAASEKRARKNAKRLANAAAKNCPNFEKNQREISKFDTKGRF